MRRARSALSRKDINWVMLQHYVTTASPGSVGRVWFDHVVVARNYIGPLNTFPPVTSPPAAPTGLRVNPS